VKLRVMTLLLCLAGTHVLAHGGVVHSDNTEAEQHLLKSILTTPSQPIYSNLGGPFQLTDHNGNQRTEVNPDGHMQLLFFGSADCSTICTVALPVMGEVVTGLAKQNLTVTPVLITIDPVRDTVASMGPALKEFHPDFIGLTGSLPELQIAYDLYAIEHEVLFTDPELGDIYAHDSNIYLLDANGNYLTYVPQNMSIKSIEKIVLEYAGAGS